MPQFSILVSELTPELLKQAEYWKLFKTTCSRPWADVRHRDDLSHPGDGGRYTLIDADCEQGYSSTVRCFPVTLSPDGTEVRLECPRMPDEVLIAEWSDTVETTATLHGMTSTVDDRPRWRLEVSGIPLTYWTLPPTPKHYPRRTCDGVWVWSTRR